MICFSSEQSIHEYITDKVSKVFVKQVKTLNSVSKLKSFPLDIIRCVQTCCQTCLSHVLEFLTDKPDINPNGKGKASCAAPDWSIIMTYVVWRDVACTAASLTLALPAPSNCCSSDMVKLTKAKTFQAYLDSCHRRYSCVHCRAHLANHDDLISKVSLLPPFCC